MSRQLDTAASDRPATPPRSAGWTSPATSRDTGFFTVIPDPNITVTPTRRRYPQQFGNVPSYGSPPLFHESVNSQCTCPLFSSSPTPGSLMTVCAKHTNVADPTPPSSLSGKEDTSGQHASSTGRDKNLKRKLQNASPSHFVPRWKNANDVHVPSSTSLRPANEAPITSASFEPWNPKGGEEDELEDDPDYSERYALSPEQG